jgi:hypothetical protein
LAIEAMGGREAFTLRSGSPIISEFWTNSKQAVVIVGKYEEVAALAGMLNLPASDLLRLANRKWGIALWGDAARAYSEHCAHRPFGNGAHALAGAPEGAGAIRQLS